MTTAARLPRSIRHIPPLLEPYLQTPPRHSLTLLTSILGASTNWLVLRFLAHALSECGLKSQSERWGEGVTGQDDAGIAKVVLVSFLRDGTFWEREGGRVGLDLPKLSKRERFYFVDGLTSLFDQSPSSTPAPSFPSPALRSPPLSSSSPPSHQTHYRDISRSSSTLRSARWTDIHDHVRDVIERAKGAGPGEGRSTARVVLVVDGIDFLLAATEPEASVTVKEPFSSTKKSVRLLDILHSWREQTHSTILTLTVDTPLLGPLTGSSAFSAYPSTSDHHSTSTPTPLETDHASLVTSVAHQARRIISLRTLDTGVARDVSGVVRIGVGGGWDGGGGEERIDERWEGEGGRLEENEFLYFVGADGGVKVFERGA
ncbi:MAG: hypothetical protein M1817_001430 [Caeruleum heppii]|nr:MAG: hypothetical protein M1817_001430 [Caeruleum heppii]